MTRFSRFTLGAALVAVLSFTSLASAQTALTATTLGAAQDGQQTTAVVASATGITGTTTGANFVFLLIDGELEAVRTVSGTTIGVTRGVAGRATAHASGATVTVAPPSAIAQSVPRGSCTRTNLTYVPYVVGGTNELGTDVGSLYDCLGGVWTATNIPMFPVLGSTVASATSITPTGTYFTVSGTTGVATVVVPAGWAAGMSLQIEPTGLWSTTTAGNILLATTGVVSKVLTLTWNGAKWVPSY